MPSTVAAVATVISKHDEDPLLPLADGEAQRPAGQHAPGGGRAPAGRQARGPGVSRS